MDSVRDIVFYGVHYGIARSTTIHSIMFEISNAEEFDLLSLWYDERDLPDLAAKAEALYEKYREEYYATIEWR